MSVTLRSNCKGDAIARDIKNRLMAVFFLKLK